MSKLWINVVLAGALAPATVSGQDISTHVLDLGKGVGGKAVPVELEIKSPAGDWTKVGSATTDDNGRVKAFSDDNKTTAGVYRLTFHMTKYKAGPSDPFFPEISVTFRVSDPAIHYHVPVVVSPFGYSTYRGN